MTSEQDWIAAMTACPGDATVMGAFADWLDENGQLERAAFLRLLWETGKVGDLRPKTHPNQSYTYWSIDGLPESMWVPMDLHHVASQIAGNCGLYGLSVVETRLLLALAWERASENKRRTWEAEMREHMEELE